MNGPRSVSPLKAWLLALVVALPIALPLLIPMTRIEPVELGVARELRFRHDLAEFLNTDRGVGNRPKGVMLAMSGGKCATVGPIRLADNGVDMYVASYPLATLASFDGLVDVLVDGTPDFIAIQDTVLLRTEPIDRNQFLYAQARSYWYGQIFALARRLNGRELESAENDSWRCWPKSDHRETWAVQVQRSKAGMSFFLDQPSTRSIEFLNNFLAAGIPVIIASPPMNTYTVNYRQGVFQAASELVSASTPLQNVSFHRQLKLLPVAHFNGPHHLSSEASQPYRAWLNSEIVRVLRVRENQ